MDYRLWVKGDDWTQLDEEALQRVDRAVAWGKQYGVHVCLNFHRAPGWTVALPKEKLSLWTDAEAQRVCALHWATFARRYKGVPSRNLSFNLFNEPSDVLPEAYAKVVKIMADAIRAEDPDRLIIADGLGYGRKPVPELLPLGVAQSTRGYEPMGLTHYRASWVKGSDLWPAPTWPCARPPGDREALRRQAIAPWLALRASGAGIHVGEWGAYHKTPHAVVLAWMRDCLENWKEAGMGWALWNFRGDFGVLDSGRADVAYEPFEGHQLDRKMLELLQAW
jgi:endoglucanase